MIFVIGDTHNNHDFGKLAQFAASRRIFGHYRLGADLDCGMTVVYRNII